MITGTRSRFIITVAVVCVVLPACNLTEPSTEIHYPFCRLASELEQPWHDPYETTMSEDLTPTFSWYYERDCRPRNYQIEVAEDPYCSIGSDWDEENEAAKVLSETIGSSLSWSPADDLEPMTKYKWHIAGIINDVVGPYSIPSCAWTGPICDPDSLVAPVQIAPADGSVHEIEWLVLVWGYPDSCLPHVIQAELYDNPDFTGENLMQVFPETKTDPQDRALSMIDPEDCTTYYWRVSARVGSVWGPTSPVWSFFTDFDGTCGGPGGTPAATATPTRTQIPMLTLAPSPTPSRTNQPTPTTAADQDPPPAPSAKSPSGGLNCIQEVSLIWDPVNDPSGIGEYRVVVQAHTGDGQWQTVVSQEGLQGTSLDLPVQCGMYYRWNVLAVDGAGNVGPSSSWMEFKVAEQ